MWDDVRFLETMWKWTIVPLFAFFTMAIVVVLLGLGGYLLGDSRALQSDGFKFSSLVAVFCVPFYLFVKGIHKAVLTFVLARNKGER